MDYTDDSVQWLGSQAACPALDNLLSEAALKPRAGLFRKPKPSKDFPSRKGPSPYTPHMASSSNSQAHSSTSTSTSSSAFTFTTASSSSRRGTPDSTLSPSYVLDDTIGASSWQASSNDYRNRLFRQSNSANGETISAPDCDRFFNLLEKASAQINDNIRNDTTTSRDPQKRRPPLNGNARVPNAYVKRAKRAVHSGYELGPASEGITKGKARDSVASTNAPMNISGRSASKAKSSGLQQDYIDCMMDLDPPKPSLEVMPPPPLPPLLKNESVIPSNETMHRPSPLPPPKPPIPLPPALSDRSSTAPSPNIPNQYKPMTQTQIASPASSHVAPGPTPKLHSLLDPERRQRRLKLERTISASLASLSSGSSDLGSPSYTTVQTPGQVNKPPPPRTHTSHQTRAIPPSQDGSNARPPPLGMRRTNTFPLTSQNSCEASNRNLKSVKPVKQKFKPPVANATQSPPTNPASRGNHSSSKRSPPPLKTLPEPPHRTDVPKPTDEDMDEDLPSNSDADFSFGETVKFDIDMDALEETMRQYD